MRLNDKRRLSIASFDGHTTKTGELRQSFIVRKAI